MGAHYCSIHGVTPHTRGCRHVKEALSCGLPLPTLCNEFKGLICIDCWTPDVQQLISAMIDAEDIETKFDYYTQVREKIGYHAICIECLYEKTGIDRRRKQGS